MKDLERHSANDSGAESHDDTLFNEEATVVARPVVPLDEREVADDVGAYVQTGAAPHAYARAWRRRTRSSVAFVALALVFGTVAGVFGLRLYQNRNEGDASVASDSSADQPVTQQPATEVAPAESAPPPASADGGSAEAAASEPQQQQSADEGESANAAAVPQRAREAEAREASPVGSSETSGRRGERNDGEDEDRSGASADRVEPIGPPRVYDTQGPAPEGSDAARRAAREEQRLRRMRRETRRGEGRGRDRAREIFEGPTESPPR